jgi:adenosylcobinamide-GDP ribazoletransferase
MHSFLVALAFLTVLPVRFRVLPSPQTVARSRFWYPVVGVLLGAALGTWTALTAAWLSPPLAAFVVLAAWVGLTGALHLDGFCDLCDGLFGGHTPEDRLRVMKDPHLGTFALTGGVLLLLGKFVALQEVIGKLAFRGPWLVAAAVVTARCLILGVAAAARYPRPDGTGKALVEGTRWWEAGPFTAIAAGASYCLTPSVSPVLALGPFGGACLVVAGLMLLCVRRLGGVTGDCLGGAIESAELVFLLTAAVLFTE